eukprot:5222749-Pleurochrysis_carterae.AAC.1
MRRTRPRPPSRGIGAHSNGERQQGSPPHCLETRSHALSSPGRKRVAGDQCHKERRSFKHVLSTAGMDPHLMQIGTRTLTHARHVRAEAS